MRWTMVPGVLPDRLEVLDDVLGGLLDLAGAFEVKAYRPGVGLSDQARRQHLQGDPSAHLLGRLAGFVGRGATTDSAGARP